MSKKKQKKPVIKKVKVVKAIPIEPDVCLVGLEMEVENAPELPTEPLPDAPLELAEEEPHKSTWGEWFKKLWS